MLGTPDPLPTEHRLRSDRRGPDRRAIERRLLRQRRVQSWDFAVDLRIRGDRRECRERRSGQDRRLIADRRDSTPRS